MEVLKKRNKTSKNRKENLSTRSVWYGGYEGDQDDLPGQLKKSLSFGTLLFDEQHSSSADEVNEIVFKQDTFDKTKSLERSPKTTVQNLSAENNSRKKISKDMITAPYNPRKIAGYEFKATSPLHKTVRLNNLGSIGNNSKKLTKHMIVGPYCPRKIKGPFGKFVEETVQDFVILEEDSGNEAVIVDPSPSSAPAAIERRTIEESEKNILDSNTARRRSSSLTIDVANEIVKFRSVRRSYSFNDLMNISASNDDRTLSVRYSRHIYGKFSTPESTDALEDATDDEANTSFERSSHLRKSLSLNNLSMRKSPTRKKFSKDMISAPLNLRKINDFDNPTLMKEATIDEQPPPYVEMEKLYFVEDFFPQPNEGSGGSSSLSRFFRKFEDTKTTRRRSSFVKDSKYYVGDGDIFNRGVEDDDDDDDDDEAACILLRMKALSKSMEVLKTLQTNNESIPTFHHHKFPLTDQDNERIEIRDNSSRPYRFSKSINFDLGRRRPTHQDFDVKGCTKILLPKKETPTKLKKNEIIRYQNGDIYKYDTVSHELELMRPQVIIKNAKLINRKEVELRDANDLTYLLYFESSKEAKLFMENDKITAYIDESDNKLNIAQKLMRLLRRRESREILEKKGIYQNEPIFGNTLKNIFTSENGMPRFITKTMALIERPENIKSLGLYRTSGNLATIQKIRFEVDKGKLDILDEYAKDPDVLTGSLKLFFRELKEPLISCSTCDSLLGIMNGEKTYTKKDKDKIRSILNRLPECNIETLNVLLRHLIEVVRYKEYNKMDSYNLAVCWGPTIIFAITDPTSFAESSLDHVVVSSKDLVMQSTEATRLFEALLNFYVHNPDELDPRCRIRQDHHHLDPNRNNILHRHGSRDSIHSSDSGNNSTKTQKTTSGVSNSDQNLNIDECLKKIVEWIELNLKNDGIYKKPGSMERTSKIMKKMTKKKIHEIDKYKGDVLELTNCLKKYLREYPECLTTKETVEQVNKLCDNNHCLEQNTRQRVKSIIRETPNKDTFIYLLKHLVRVIHHEHDHKVPRCDIVSIWTDVLNYQNRIIESSERFAIFLNTLLDVFDETKHDETIQKGMTNGLLNDLKYVQSLKEKDRISKYDNVPEESDDGNHHREATILEEKTDLEYTRL